MPASAAIATVVICLLLGASIQYGGSYVVQYELGERSLEVKLFNSVTILKVPYSDTDTVQMVTFWESFKPHVGWHFFNRVFYENAVFIKRKSFSPFCRILITPSNPEEFLRLLMSRLPRRL